MLRQEEALTVSLYVSTIFGIEDMVPMER